MGRFRQGLTGAMPLVRQGESSGCPAQARRSKPVQYAATASAITGLPLTERSLMCRAAHGYCRSESTTSEGVSARRRRSTPLCAGGCPIDLLSAHLQAQHLAKDVQDRAHRQVGVGGDALPEAAAKTSEAVKLS